MMSGLTLDAGALIALDRGRREVIALLTAVAERGGEVIIPAGAFAQAMRDPARQARLSRLARQSSTKVAALDRVDATLVGRMLAVTGTSDVVDAHVVSCAQRAGTAVVTSDPDDLRALDPQLRIVAL